MFNETPAENVSVESQHPVLATLNSKIAELESTIERQKGTITNYSNIVDSKQRLLDAIESFIKEKTEEGDIDLELAKEIADILGIDLNKTFEIELTFKASVSVSVPIDFTGDIDDVAQDFYAKLCYGGVGDVDSEDIELEDWRDNS